MSPAIGLLVGAVPIEVDQIERALGDGDVELAGEPASDVGGGGVPGGCQGDARVLADEEVHRVQAYRLAGTQLELAVLDVDRAGVPDRVSRAGDRDRGACCS